MTTLQEQQILEGKGQVQYELFDDCFLLCGVISLLLSFN